MDNLGAYIGPAAGITTSILWTATSLLFTAGGKRIGATAVNVFRIWLAVALLGITHRLWFGSWFPETVGNQVLYLGLSGVIGLSIGDQALFTAFVHIGPRLSMLIMATSPIFATLFGWIGLGETLAPLSFVGMGLTIFGVAWVVLERQPTVPTTDRSHRGRGVFYAFVGAACQAGGLLLSKQGIGHGWLPAEAHMNPQAAAYVRMIFAGLGVLPILALHLARRRKRLAAGVESPTYGSTRTGYIFAACGAFVGPFLGMWMSLVAVNYAKMGVAQTLCSLSPVFILPFAIGIHKERIGPRAAIGAVIAVGGSAMLFLNPR